MEGFCPFARCLGLHGHAFVSREPHVVVRAREPRDGLVLVAPAATLDALSALEATTIVATMVSAAEMQRELVRIAQQRGLDGAVLAIAAIDSW